MTLAYIPLITESYDPTDWQKEDLDYLDQRVHSANWSEMGCYKTTTALWLMDRKMKRIAEHGFNRCPAVLIITTKAGKGTYFDAFPKTLPNYRVFSVDTNKAEEIIAGQFRQKVSLPGLVTVLKSEVANPRPIVIIAHYHCFLNKSKMKDVLADIMWSMIICDESHRMKERNTQWTRNIKMLGCWTGYKHIMTGTGFINRPDEMWSPLNFLDSKTYGSYQRFRKVFCEIEDWSGFEKVVGVKPEMLETFRHMRKTLGPRRMMTEVHKNVSEPIYTPVEVDLNPTQRRMYSELKTQLRALDQAGMAIDTPNVLSLLNRLRQICVATPEKYGEYYDEGQERWIQQIRLIEPSSKLDAVEEILEGLEWDDEHKQQTVVFSNFKDPLLLLQKRLDARFAEAEKNAEDGTRWRYLRLLQTQNEEQRYKLWHDIWPMKQHGIFLTTLQLGSESINLSSAQHAIFLDRSWSPKDNMQAVARIFRPGQTGIPNIININARGTTDQRVEQANRDKLNWFNQIFGDDEDV